MLYSKYQLHTSVDLNTKSTRHTFPGLLISDHGGYAAIHPWTEFNDAPWEQQLQTLKEQGSTPLIQMALNALKIDSQARNNQQFCFDSLEIPISHYTWAHSLPDSVQIERINEEQWPAIKCKGSRDIATLAEWLNQLIHQLSHSIQLRIDFNSCLDEKQYYHFIQLLTPATRQRINCIEDPFPYQPITWQQAQQDLSIPLALDKAWNHEDTEIGFTYVVIKPSRRPWQVITQKFPNHKYIFTSAMDHPLSQLYAAYEAAQALKALPHQQLSWAGLSTQHLFINLNTKDDFTTVGGKFHFSKNQIGLGCQNLLHSTEWQLI
jgi:O-succinylbenzoate synthase